MGERESKMAQQKNTPNTIHSIQKGSTNKEVPIICTDLLHSVANFSKKKKKKQINKQTKNSPFSVYFLTSTFAF